MTPLDPFRKVIRVHLIGQREKRGCIKATAVWRLLLECGHFLTRTESKAYVLKARCWECGDQ